MRRFANKVIVSHRSAETEDTTIKGKFDIIIFNPPYLPDIKEKIAGDKITKNWINVALDGGDDGRRIIFRFLEEAGSHLVENGRVLMVVSSLTGIDEVNSKMRSLNYIVGEKGQERFMFEQLVVLSGTKRAGF